MIASVYTNVQFTYIHTILYIHTYSMYMIGWMYIMRHIKSIFGVSVHMYIHTDMHILPHLAVIPVLCSLVC